jgi:hypothetical protein
VTNIKRISDLRKYTLVLRDIALGEPVFLTKNGIGKFAIIDIHEYETLKASLKLISQLSQGEQAGKDNGWMSIDEVESALRLKRG